MDLFGRYVFWQVLGALTMITSTLTSIVWIALALKQLKLLTSQGQGFDIFLKMTSLAVPSLTATIMPIALLIASVHVLNRLNSDSELIVMAASGASVWRLSRPFILIALVACVYVAVVSLYIQPLSMQSLRHYIIKVRTDLISQALQPGKFSSTMANMTFHLRARDSNGDLLGLVVQDNRDPKQKMTYLAERGRIVKQGNLAYLVMINGHIHRRNPQLDQTQIVSFDQYVFDLTNFGPKTGKILYEPRERDFLDLWQPDKDDPLFKARPGLFRAELHERLVGILYPMVFIFIVLWQLGTARTTRQGRTQSILLSFGIAAGLRVVGLGATSLATKNAAAVPLIYAVPVLAMIVTAVLITGSLTGSRVRRLAAGTQQ